MARWAALFQMGIVLSMVAGPLLGGVLAARNLRYAYASSAVLCVANAALVGGAVLIASHHRTPHPPTHTASIASACVAGTLSTPPHHPPRRFPRARRQPCLAAHRGFAPPLCPPAADSLSNLPQVATIPETLQAKDRRPFNLGGTRGMCSPPPAVACVLRLPASCQTVVASHRRSSCTSDHRCPVVGRAAHGRCAGQSDQLHQAVLQRPAAMPAQPGHSARHTGRDAAAAQRCSGLPDAGAPNTTGRPTQLAGCCCQTCIVSSLAHTLVQACRTPIGHCCGD